MDAYAVYNSPFRSSIFETSKHKTVREVYRERIKQIYYKQFPSLLLPKSTDDDNKNDENGEDKLGKEDQAIENDQENEDKQADDDHNDDKNGQNKPEIIPNDENNKADDKENNNKKKDDEQNEKKEDIKKEHAKGEDKDEENKEESDKKKEKEDKNEIISIEEQKLKHALELLDTEYFGSEHDLYLKIFNKYNDETDNNSAEIEYFLPTYTTPLISELLITEYGENILCSECLQEYSYREFPEDELLNNGYYLACSRCAPDRNNVISLKWHKEFKSDAVILENNGYLAKVITSNHRYCTIDQRGVTKGVHVWRWCTKQYSSWFLWGISSSKKYTDNSYGNQGVYGIAGSNQSYKNGQCAYDIQTAVFFGKNKVLIDMMLDLNKGELKFKIPGNATEAKMVAIPKENVNGWVPHCNIHYANANVQVKKIPISWYGKMPKRVKFQ